jgi:chromosome segregation ATPase
MDQPLLSTQLDDLEQKHQSGQAKMAELEQRLESQTYTLQEQSHRLQKLEQELAESRLSLARLPQLDERLDRMKSELLQIIEDRFSRRQPGAVESGPVMAQLDNHTKALNELRRDMDKTRRYDEQMTLARTEIERLNKAVGVFQADADRLTKQLDERIRATKYMEEQRLADARRLAELQAELTPLQKKLEASQSKIQLVEQQIPQFGKYEAALEEIREEIRRHREYMDFQTAQRERQMKIWNEQAELQTRRIDEFESTMEKYGEHYQLNRRALTSLQDFQERLQREQHQSQELLRLAEERQRAEMEKLQASYGQRWQKQNMEWTTQATDLQKTIEDLKKRTDEMAKFNQSIEKQLNLLLQIIEEDIQARAVAAQEWQQHFEKLADGQA